MYTFILIAAFLSLTGAQLSFQGIDTNQNRQPTTHNRQPIESDKCLEGEYLYPGDNEKDWVCDCKPTYVYYPINMKCYPVYSQGPCKKGEILVLPMKKSTPQCMRNPCGLNEISFHGRCGRLNENSICPNKHVKLQIDATTLQPTCTFLSTRFEEETYCYIGSKRSQEGKCENSESTTAAAAE